MDVEKMLQKLWDKGRKYLKNGEYDSAEKVFMNMIELSPGCTTAYYGITMCNLDQGRHDMAIIFGESGLITNSSFKGLNLLVGNAYYDKGELDRAIEYWKKEISVNPDEADSYSNISCALCDIGRYREAVEWCNKALKVNPNLRNAYINLARALSKLGFKKEADRAARKAREELTHTYE